jgi:hypothetical protein
MPTVDDVDRIVVTSTDGSVEDMLGEKPPLTRVIENRDQIAQIVAFVAAHPRGWHQPWDTPANTVHSITFERDQRVVFAFRLDCEGMNSDWAGTYKVRRLDARESQTIHELLGLKTLDKELPNSVTMRTAPAVKFVDKMTHGAIMLCRLICIPLAVGVA